MLTGAVADVDAVVVEAGGPATPLTSVPLAAVACTTTSPPGVTTGHAGGDDIDELQFDSIDPEDGDDDEEDMGYTDVTGSTMTTGGDVIETATVVDGFRTWPVTAGATDGAAIWRLVHELCDCRNTSGFLKRNERKQCQTSATNVNVFLSKLRHSCDVRMSKHKALIPDVEIVQSFTKNRNELAKKKDRRASSSIVLYTTTLLLTTESQLELFAGPHILPRRGSRGRGVGSR